MKLPCMLPALAASLCLVVCAGGIAAEIESAELNFAVTTDEDWSNAEAAITKLLTQATSQSAVAHAQKKGMSASPSTVDSSVLVVYSKLPLGTLGDNPNVILAKEKAWAEGFEQSGAGYLKLMQDRVKLLGAPTEFVGKSKVMKIGNVEFHEMDAVNTRIPAAETKQRYICTFRDGYYVFFVLSFNDEDDADYLKMMKAVKSFRSLKQ